MSNYRTLDDVTIEYFTLHPEEIDDFLHETFADYAEDGDASILLSALHIVARIKGLDTIANEVALRRYELQTTLPKEGTLYLENINVIMQAMGYQLLPHRLESQVL